MASYIFQKVLVLGSSYPLTVFPSRRLRRRNLRILAAPCKNEAMRQENPYTRRTDVWGAPLVFGPFPGQKAAPLTPKNTVYLIDIKTNI